MLTIPRTVSEAENFLCMTVGTYGIVELDKVFLIGGEKLSHSISVSLRQECHHDSQLLKKVLMNLVSDGGLINLQILGKYPHQLPKIFIDIDKFQPLNNVRSSIMPFPICKMMATSTLAAFRFFLTLTRSLPSMKIFVVGELGFLASYEITCY